MSNDQGPRSKAGDQTRPWAVRYAHWPGEYSALRCVMFTSCCSRSASSRAMSFCLCSSIAAFARHPLSAPAGLALAMDALLQNPNRPLLTPRETRAYAVGGGPGRRHSMLWDRAVDAARGPMSRTSPYQSYGPHESLKVTGWFFRKILWVGCRKIRFRKVLKRPAGAGLPAGRPAGAGALPAGAGLPRPRRRWADGKLQPNPERQPSHLAQNYSELSHSLRT